MNNAGKALAEFLEVEEDDIEYVSYGGPGQYKYGREEYLVFEETEAYDEARRAAKELLWAFKADYLAYYLEISETAIEAMQEKMSEDCNEDLISIADNADNLDDLLDAAIDEDGMGQFIATYDGEENEVVLDGVTYYIFRTN